RHERDDARAETEALRQKARAWEIEREELVAQWRRDHDAGLGELERQLRDEQAQQLSERESQLAAKGKELDQLRDALAEATEKAARETDALRQERDASREALESVRGQGEAERQALQDRLAEVARVGQSEQERLNADLGRAEAARRQLEQDCQVRQAEIQRLRSDLDSARHDYQEARAAAEEEGRRLTEELEARRAQCDALCGERDALKAHVDQAIQGAEKERQELLASAQRDFDHERQVLRDEASRQQGQVESLGQEREILRRRIETLQQESSERTESWEDERKTTLAKLQQGSQQYVELDKRFRAEQATAADLRAQLETSRQTAPADANVLRQDMEAMRRQLDETNVELTQTRLQKDQHGQAWTIEKRSLQAHHQEECRRLTEEFEQRLKAELNRCKETYEDQLEGLQRERDAARTHFEVLKQAVYHPKQAGSDDDGIPRLPEVSQAALQPDRALLEERLVAEQAQMQGVMRKHRQQMEDQRKQFEEERQVLLAELHRLRQKSASHGTEDNRGDPTSAGTWRQSWIFRLFLYVILFLLATAAVVAGGVALKMAGRG
ncbi:MAG TPA: hypothetical protein VKE94_03955, partial [Gemmataceae bacterium]|nr:hypothetical protein [Gemmataceae bacterium]